MADKVRAKGSANGKYTGTRSNNTENGVWEKPLHGCAPQVATTCQLCQTPTGGQDTKALICKRCKKNYCIKCLKKDEVEHVILQKHDTGIMWFCPYCEESVEKSIAVEQMIEEKCQQITSFFEERLHELESKLEKKCDERRVVEIVQEQLKGEERATPPSWADIVKNADPKEKSLAFNSVLTELDERKSRERNIVLFGIMEQSGDSGEERHQRDLDIVRDVFKTCKVRTNADSFVRVSRLGKYNTGGTEDPARFGRPILVTLQNMELKTSLFRKISALHQTDTYKSVRIANDLTRTEREKERELYEEAKEKQRKSSGEFTYKVRGPPWARRVVRIPKTH